MDNRVYLKEVKSLKKGGYDVVFINKDKEEIDEDGVILKRIEIKGGRFKRAFAAPLTMYKMAIREKADACHFHDPDIILAGVLLRIRGKKVIYDVHEDIPRQILSKPYLKPFVRKPSSFFFNLYEKLCAHSFNMNIAATPTIAGIFKKNHCKSFDLDNYPKLSEFQVEEPPEASAESEPRTRVAYVGYVTRLRGAVEMVEAAGKSKAQLDLIGPIEGEGLRDELKSMSGWSSVIEHGYQGRAGIAKIFAGCAAGLVTLHPIPNHIDAQATKMYEYMLAGLPVIASDFPLWRSILEEGQCGICVDPLNTDEIATAIDYILEHPEEAREMGERGKQLIINKYNWGVEEKKLLDFYRELIGE
jgi:glycosyltransferase involved in cell wall biosynthesis